MWGRVVAGAAAVAVGLAILPTEAVTAAPAPSRERAPGTEEAATAASNWTVTPPRGERQEVPEDRYALAGGCYVVRSLAADAYLTKTGGSYPARGAPDEAEPFRFPATDLGSYLLYDRDEQVVAGAEGALAALLGEVTDTPVGGAAEGLSRGNLSEVEQQLVESELGTASGRGSSIVPAAEPNGLADWRLEELRDGGFRLHQVGLDRVLLVEDDGQLALGSPDWERGSDRFAFELADGCAEWPEIELNVDGPVARGATPWGQVRGYLDAHLHGMAYEFLGGRARCGKPWSRYGVADALKGCPEHDLLGGRTHILETALSGRDPVEGHDTTGWPTFAEWPEHWSLTYEQTYHRWLERAWRGGLRMYVNLLVDNNKLCDVYPFKHNSCNEMDGVRLQAQRLREFERYIDAQNGGPGRGWLRIVTDPFEARRVMNEGKLAVVMGIEVSVLFDCGITQDQPKCDAAEIDRELEAVYDLGVRQMELVNKFDNALSGVAGDAGETGLLVNGANFLETGSFWRMGECPGAEDHAVDRTHPNIPDEAGLPDELGARDALVGMVLEGVGTTGLAPLYAGGPHCNQMGMTDLGAHVIHRMIDRGMIFDPDHMSAIARAEAMDLIEAEGYSGVVSSHSWADEGIYERVLGVGGVVTPMAGNSAGFVGKWLQQRSWYDDRFFSGIGFGSDINGFATQGGPRGGDGPKVDYPFEGLGGVTIDQQVSGERVFDINSDGVAHYGLYPDWVEDLRVQAGDDIVDDLARGSEAYLQMWERAVGIAPDSCRPDVAPLRATDVAGIERGMTPEEVLLAVGQPRDRDGSSFLYCSERGTAEVRFGTDGTVRQVIERGGQGRTVPSLVLGGPDELRAAEVAAQAAEDEARSPEIVHTHGDEGHGDEGHGHDAPDATVGDARGTRARGADDAGHGGGASVPARGGHEGHAHAGDDHGTGAHAPADADGDDHDADADDADRDDPVAGDADEETSALAETAGSDRSGPIQLAVTLLALTLLALLAARALGGHRKQAPSPR